MIDAKIVALSGQVPRTAQTLHLKSGMDRETLLVVRELSSTILHLLKKGEQYFPLTLTTSIVMLDQKPGYE